MTILPLIITLDDPFLVNYQYVYDKLLRKWNVGGKTVATRDLNNVIDIVTENVAKITCATTTTTTSKCDSIFIRNSPAASLP